jgi:hypothetical protein
MSDAANAQSGTATATPDRKNEITIIVNARKKVVDSQVVSFDQLLDLAYDGHPNPGPNIVFTVTYRNAASRPSEGSMVEGDKVEVKNETIFNVTRTDKS